MRFNLIIMVLLLAFFTNSCEVSKMLEKQHEFMEDLKITNSLIEIELINDINIIQTRGVIETKYECHLGKGHYELLWTSNNGEFYLTKGENFLCEQSSIGGILVLEKGKEYLVWSYPIGFSSKKKTIEKLKDQKFVERFNNVSSVKPFIHTYNLISNKEIIQQ